MKNSKLLKRILLPVFVLMLSIFLFAPQAQASTKSSAMKAYKRFLAKSTIPWGYGNHTIKNISSKNVEFALVYVDNNAVPELFVYGTKNPHSLSALMLCTYKDGKVKRLAVSDSFGYYSKTGIFETVSYRQGMFVNVYKLYKGKATVKLNISRDIYYKVSGSKYTKITKNTYNNTLKKLTKGKKLSGDNIKTHKNTAYQRSKYLK